MGFMLYLSNCRWDFFFVVGFTSLVPVLIASGLLLGGSDTDFLHSRMVARSGCLLVLLTFAVIVCSSITSAMFKHPHDSVMSVMG